jgi:hypothetical protein
MGTGSFPGVKRQERGADHPPPSRAEIKKESSDTSTHPLGHFRPVTGLLYIFLPDLLNNNVEKNAIKKHLTK